MERGSGILLAISSLPSNYGVGTLGKASYEFVDYLVKCKAKYWQVLPIVPTSYGDSPYQAPSSKAGSEYYIDLDTLCSEGLLTQKELDNIVVSSNRRTDYAQLFVERTKILRLAFGRFDKSNASYREFLAKGKFHNYGIYMALKRKYDFKQWTEWEDKYKHRDAEAIAEIEKSESETIEFYEFCQFMFFEQWKKLKSYANGLGIKIIGDIPIYVAMDSVDVYSAPQLFDLDESLTPKKVAGVPPDAFSTTGQLWGNPLYNWALMAKDDFSWWRERLLDALDIYDIVRIDHFRGFDRFFAIEYGSLDAKVGKWEVAPGASLFQKIAYDIDKDRIIAEDLGLIDASARKMFDTVGYMGMKILQFGFSENDKSEHFPCNITENFSAYTGTHDNETLYQHFVGMDKAELKRNVESIKLAKDKLKVATPAPKDIDEICEDVIELCFASKAKLSIIPLTDLMHSPKSHRMNLPSTVSVDNWSFRALTTDFTEEIADKFATRVQKYLRG